MEAIQEVRSGKMDWRQGAAVASLAKALIESTKLDLTIAQLWRSRDAQTLPTEIMTPVIGHELDAIPVADDALRTRIHDHLTKEGPLKPALIASDLEITPDKVEAAVNHEWFMRTLDGIAVAK